MQIQINTDSHIKADGNLRESVEAEVSDALGRFAERLTRVEVHLTDVNAQKGGRDTRCVIEARPAGLPPVTVDDLADSVPGAVRGAAEKMARALDSRLGRLDRR